MDVSGTGFGFSPSGNLVLSQVKTDQDHRTRDTDVKTLQKAKRNDQLVRFATHMNKMVVGQPKAIDKLSDSFSRLIAGVHDPESPLLTMMFMGPTGVGKTETVRALAETVFGNKRARSASSAPPSPQLQKVPACRSSPEWFGRLGRIYRCMACNVP